jgi:hypothetical protein
MKPFARVNAPIKRLGASRSQTRAVEPIGALVGARFLTRRDDVVGSLGATAVWTSRRGGRSSLPSRARVHAGFDDARTSDADANAKPRRRALTAHGHARDSDDDDAREGIASRPRRGGGRSVKNRSSWTKKMMATATRACGAPCAARAGVAPRTRAQCAFSRETSARATGVGGWSNGARNARASAVRCVARSKPQNGGVAESAAAAGAMRAGAGKPQLTTARSAIAVRAIAPIIDDVRALFSPSSRRARRASPPSPPASPRAGRRSEVYPLDAWIFSRTNLRSFFPPSSLSALPSPLR